MKEPENIVLVQLIGLRREMAALIEDRIRDRELIVRLAQRMEEGFANLRSELQGLRREQQELRHDQQEVKSDIVLLENRLLSRHGEILSIPRLDALGLPRDDEFGEKPPAA